MSKRFVGKYNPFAPSEPEEGLTTPKIIPVQPPRGLRTKKYPPGADPFAPSKELEFTPIPGAQSSEPQERVSPKGIKFSLGKDSFVTSEELQSSKTARTPPKQDFSSPVQPTIKAKDVRLGMRGEQRRKVNQFATSVDWNSESQQEILHVEKPRAQPPTISVTQATEAGPVAPRKKPNQFASSFDWKAELNQDHHQVERPRPKTVPPSTVSVTQPTESGPVAPKQKPNLFASSMNWNDNEEPTSVTQSTIVKHAQTLET